MSRQINFHLARARAAASGAAGAAPCSVAASAEALVRTVTRLYAHRNLEISVEAAPEISVRVQREDLDEMLGNVGGRRRSRRRPPQRLFEPCSLTVTDLPHRSATLSFRLTGWQSLVLPPRVPAQSLPELGGLGRRPDFAVQDLLVRDFAPVQLLVVLRRRAQCRTLESHAGKHAL